MGVIPRLLRWIFRIGVVVLTLTVGAVLYLSHQNLQRYGAGPSEPVDAVIVLGGGIDADGVPSYSTRRRVIGAVRLLEAGRTRYLILSGGPSRNPPGTRGAELMRDQALALGADEAALILEPDSASTFENLRFSFDLADAQGFRRLGVLTDAFHLERAMRLAAFLGRPGIEPVAVGGLGHDQPALRVWSILREALAWWFNIGKVAAWEGLGLAGLDPDSRAALVR